jgi:hypothetical protein
MFFHKIPEEREMLTYLIFDVESLPESVLSRANLAEWQNTEKKARHRLATSLGSMYVDRSYDMVRWELKNEGVSDVLRIIDNLGVPPQRVRIEDSPLIDSNMIRPPCGCATIGQSHIRIDMYAESSNMGGAVANIFIDSTSVTAAYEQYLKLRTGQLTSLAVSYDKPVEPPQG